MAENNKGGIFTSAKKNLIRKKTQVLQSLGKTGKTTDDLLSEDCQRLEKQQEVATKFQKDLRNYIHSARSLAHASKQFYTTASETYEPEWDNHERVTELLKNMEVLWEDYLQKLNDQIHEPLTKYLACIPQIKLRVAKRGRKLIDYDNAKHNLEVQQNAKKKDDAKSAKAQEDLDHAKKIYEDLNNELHQELPEFHNSRLGFYGNLFQNLFTAENVFYTEAGKGCQEIAAAGGKMASDNAEHTYTPRKSVRNTIIVGSDENLVNGHGDSGPDSPQPDTPSPSSSPTSPEPLVADRSLSNDTEESKPVENSTQISQEPAVSDAAEKTEEAVTEVVKVEEKPEDKAEETKQEEPQSNTVSETVSEEVGKDKNEEAEEEEEEKPKVNGDLETSNSTEPEVPDTAPPPVPVSLPPEEDTKKEADMELATQTVVETVNAVVNNVSDDDNPDDEGLYQVPPLAKPVGDDYPPKYKYTVCATHNYKGEDDDELSFDAKEIIYVMEFENPEEQKKIIEKKKTEQDPGWLMGMKKTTRAVGVFPENFTTTIRPDSEGEPVQT